MLRLDLLFNSDEEFEGIFAQLWQLSHERMTAPSGVRSWMHQRRMDATLRQVLVNPGSPVVRHLQEVLAEAEIPATAQDLVQWFHAMLAAGPSVMVLPARPGPTPQAPTDQHKCPGGEVPTPTGRAPAPGDARGRLWPLLEGGLLRPGALLVLAKGERTVAEATLDADGRIVFDGHPYRSPSDKTFARLLGRQSLNGWREWRVDLPSGRIRLEILRQKLGAPAGIDEVETGSG